MAHSTGLSSAFPVGFWVEEFSSPPPRMTFISPAPPPPLWLLPLPTPPTCEVALFLLASTAVGDELLELLVTPPLRMVVVVVLGGKLCFVVGTALLNPWCWWIPELYMTALSSVVCWIIWWISSNCSLRLWGELSWGLEGHLRTIPPKEEEHFPICK